MATKTASVIQSGTSNYLTPAESFNVVATDTLTPGIVGSYTSTSGVAPTTGSFAVNAQGSPNMTVAVSAGTAFVNATPTSGTAQNIRVKLASSENVTIAANSTGGTRYDFVYVKVDADKLNNPAADGTDVVTLTTQRSTTSTVDSNGALANALCIAIVTVANGAVSIANADISDYRISAHEADGFKSCNETHVYASATTVTVPSGALGRYSVGDKYRIYQNNTIKYFYIVTVVDTLLTITGGSDYTLTNSTISNPCTSRRATPVGFPGEFAYTPTWTNLTVGSATQAFYFKLEGKQCTVRVGITLSGSTMGSNPTFTLPITASSTIKFNYEAGSLYFEDAASAGYMGTGHLLTTTTCQPIIWNTASTYAAPAGIAAAVPFAWGNSDYISGTITYPIG